MKNPKFLLPPQFALKVTSQIKPQIDHIAKCFAKSIRFAPKDDKLIFGLPYRYVVPDNRHFREFFYWDSFYMLLGLLVYEDTKTLCEDILKNFAYEMKRFGRIPNSNTYFSLSRSQPAYFALALWEYLKKYPADINKSWLNECIKQCIREYWEYWMATDKRHAYHLLENGLSRYWDLNVDIDGLTVYESGWDMSSRFNNGCMTLNPIDLNSQLYLYEKFFQWYFDKKKNPAEAQKWKNRIKTRARLIDKYCWNSKKGIYFDYHFFNKKTTDFVSVASFFPFFAGFPDKEKAKKSIPKLLEILEKEGGLAASEKVPQAASKTNQWDYPHGWAPLHYYAYHALLNYGFNKDAERIKTKWLKLCDYWFKKDGGFHEKFNVVKIGNKVASDTPSRPDYGWTMAIYLKFLFDDRK